MDVTTILLGAQAALVALLLLGEARENRALQTIAKPLASACFVALAWLHASTPILIALAISFVGDVLLIPRNPKIFRAGILAFLLAHVAFIAAFVWRADLLTSALALVPLVIAAAIVMRWLLPHVDRALKGAVWAYVAVITLMVASAAGAGFVVVPALLFWANDILVARDRFVKKAFWHRLVGLPLYYAAMAMFALTA